MTRAAAQPRVYPAHYGDLRAHATQWWALQRARIRLTQAAGAAKRAGWGTADDELSAGLAAVTKTERAAARATVRALAAVYPVVAQLVEETKGLGPAVALFLGLVPPLLRLEEFPGFPCPSALWAYSGLSAERRQKCDRRARMIAITYIATPALIRNPEFRDLYKTRRATTLTRGWTKMHAHRDAVRYVAKRILRSLWLCRLPVGSPFLSLASERHVTVAGASPSVASPTDTRMPLENPHGDEASAPELVVSPAQHLLSVLQLTAPEPVVSPELLLPSLHDVSAPETA